jgi:N-acetyl-anhydromuramyl-L-alanine amidase AmpD
MTTLQTQAKENIAQSVLKNTLILCEALSHKAPDGYWFYAETGKKYHKVILEIENGSRSVHCFIDKNTGEVYKSASWKAPAKGVRFDLRIIEQREWLLQNADWAGGYLYNR